MKKLLIILFYLISNSLLLFGFKVDKHLHSDKETVSKYFSLTKEAKLTDIQKDIQKFLKVGLFKKSLHLDDRDDNGNTILGLAIEHGRLDVVELLLNLNADPNKPVDKYNTSPLIKACEVAQKIKNGPIINSYQILLRLIKHPETNLKTQANQFNHLGIMGQTIIHYAAQSHNVSLVKAILIELKNKFKEFGKESKIPPLKLLNMDQQFVDFLNTSDSKGRTALDLVQQEQEKLIDQSTFLRQANTEIITILRDALSEEHRKETKKITGQYLPEVLTDLIAQYVTAEREKTPELRKLE